MPKTANCSSALQNVNEVLDDIINIFRSHTSIERQGDLILKEPVSVGIVLDVDAHGLVGSHHRQGLVVHVGSNAPFGHLLDDAVAVLARLTRESGDVEVSAACMLFAARVFRAGEDRQDSMEEEQKA